MSETQDLIKLWQQASAAGEDISLATVVRVEGSSYRKPGARMLLTHGGRRSGMVSGGCLEGEISRKIWWLTENGPSLQRYVSSFDDDAPTSEQPAYGLGCGGTVTVLMERASTARGALQALQASIQNREPSAVLTVIASTHPDVAIGGRLILTSASSTPSEAIRENTLPCGLDVVSIARQTLEQRHHSTHTIEYQQHTLQILAEYIAPPFALFICGAGDDALPLADLAYTMGWHTTVADGRSNIVRAERFPRANMLTLLNDAAPLLGLGIHASDPGTIANSGAVLLTHSYVQDRELLRALLPLNLQYLGVLGPRSRTLRLVEEVAASLHLSTDDCMVRLHAPVGLDLGADTPTGIALAIVAEIHATLHARTAVPLREKASASAHQ